MPAYATTVYPAKAALDTLLRAHSWPGPDNPPAILWGEPVDSDENSFDLIYQSQPETSSDQYLTLGAGRLTEEYELLVIADVFRYGNDEKATEARAYSHLNEIVRIVDADPTISGTVNRVTGFRFTPVSQPPAPELWRAQITVRFAVVGYVDVS